MQASAFWLFFSWPPFNKKTIFFKKAVNIFFFWWVCGQSVLKKGALDEEYEYNDLGGCGTEYGS